MAKSDAFEIEFEYRNWEAEAEAIISDFLGNVSVDFSGEEAIESDTFGGAGVEKENGMYSMGEHSVEIGENNVETLRGDIYSDAGAEKDKYGVDGNEYDVETLKVDIFGGAGSENGGCSVNEGIVGIGEYAAVMLKGNSFSHAGEEKGDTDVESNDHGEAMLKVNAFIGMFTAKGEHNGESSECGAEAFQGDVFKGNAFIGTCTEKGECGESGEYGEETLEGDVFIGACTETDGESMLMDNAFIGARTAKNKHGGDSGEYDAETLQGNIFKGNAFISTRMAKGECSESGEYGEDALEGDVFIGACTEKVKFGAEAVFDSDEFFRAGWSEEANIVAWSMDTLELRARLEYIDDTQELQQVSKEMQEVRDGIEEVRQAHGLPEELEIRYQDWWKEVTCLLDGHREVLRQRPQQQRSRYDRTAQRANRRRRRRNEGEMRV